MSMTAEQLIELPGDGWRHELIDGELTTFPYATWREGVIGAHLTGLVGMCVHREQQKMLSWVDAGVRLVWVVDPETAVVTVHRPGNVGTLLQGAEATLSGEDVLPGFTVRLGDIFG